MAARAWIVSGRVQGVWFRGSTRREALALGVDGTAVNLPDGTVRVDAWGEAATLEALARYLAEGPRDARVTCVRAVPVAGQRPRGFVTG